MANILLLGAGFSANWNVPVARTFFDWLLQRPEIEGDDSLKNILWRHKDTGGFENALAEVQLEYLNNRSAEAKERLTRFQAALNGIFLQIDAGFAHRPDWDFNNEVGYRLVDLFVGFDAIFTLNQDLLFERSYLNDNVVLAAPGKWAGCAIPGMRNPEYQSDPGSRIWVPDPTRFSVDRRTQPYFKLHGSYRWLDDTGNQLMIMGGGKSSAIRSHPVLGWYQNEFKRYLNQGDTRLMVVGYGFADQHINDEILAAKSTGLRLFIVDPRGVDVANPDRDLPLRRQNPFQKMIASASATPFNQSFAADDRMEVRRLKAFIKP